MNSTNFLGSLLGIALLISLGILWGRYRKLQREKFIREAPFPKGLLDRLNKHYPDLALKDKLLVSRALRQYFLTYHQSGYLYVSMPSQVVDYLWHEFILYTRNYELFCKQAFGRFFHHTPAVVLSADKRNNAGLRRAWWHACKEENINPRQATRLPLLFAIDAKLGIASPFIYSLDCKTNPDGSSCCAGDFGDASIDGDTTGFGDSSSDSGFSFGDSSSDGGGDGCGGGGCGGGGD